MNHPAVLGSKPQAAGTRLSRRHFVQSAGAVGLGLVAGCGLPTPRLRQPAKVHRIGYHAQASVPPTSDPYVDAFRQALSELGWVEGQNLVIEWRSNEGSPRPTSDLAVEWVDLQVEAIVTTAEPTARAIQEVTSTIPIIMTNSTDPVRLGIVASLARPGGNVTGLATLASETAGKRLELLKETAPGLSRVFLLGGPSPHYELWLRDLEVAAPLLAVHLQAVPPRGVDDLEAGFETVARERSEALIVQEGPPQIAARARIVDFAAKNRLPAIGLFREFAEAGGLMSYGPSFPAMFRRAAYYVDRVLKGTKPADLPIEQAMRFDLVINLRTAQALGLTIPPHVLLQATEVIQ
jgi:putative tryptophan/tyrosine transport system substrate-binding protein